MKVAIAVDKNKCSDHFGHCEGFKIYDIVDKKITNEEFISNPGHKPGFLPIFLSGRGVNVIISSGMGSAAQDLFKKENIDVIVGCQGSLEKIIEDYINGNIISDQSICDKHEFDGNCNN